MQLVCFDGISQILNQFISVDAVERFALIKHNQMYWFLSFYDGSFNINLEVKICSIVDGFGLQVACDSGMSVLSLSLTVLMMRVLGQFYGERRGG